MPTNPCARLLLLAATLLITSQQLSAGSWPAAWLRPAKTASMIGLSTFHQSPMLDDKGLPPVAERLPDDPVVSEPLDSLGKHGGTARLLSTDTGVFNNVEGLFTIAPDYKTILPNVAESWAYSDDGRTLTVKLRNGLKWSDGRPVTAEDLLFATNDLQLNPDFQPVTPRILRGLELHATDPHTLVYTFASPSPLFINYMAQFPEAFIAPKHYFAQFHPDYTDPDALSARLRRMGYLNWSTFVNASLQLRIEDAIEQPTLRAWRLVRFTPSLHRFERNPYYFKVDTVGRQLPYIDTLEAEVVSDVTVSIAKASTGQIDFAGFTMPTKEIPLLKLGEQASGIDVKIWRRLHGSDLAIQFNLNHPDERLRSLFSEADFRRAMSLSINREEMNEIIYFGRGVPRQVTVIPESDYFEPRFGEAWTEYDPDTAAAMLDGLGLIDTDGDGFRDYPDGSKFTLSIEYVDTETPKQISMELVVSYWAGVGIDARLKLIDRGLQFARATAGEMEMTVWHADRTTDVLFPLFPDFWVPRKIAASLSMWNDWSLWNITDGKMGKEPPDHILALQQAADTMATTMDPAERIRAGKKILASNADNVWLIGTIGSAPHPIVISDRLKNVPDEGIWGWDIRWTIPYHLPTWYLER